MARPVAVFGLPDQKFINRVMLLRKTLLKDGKIEDKELMTIPHLTLLINTTLDDMISNEFLSQKISHFVSSLKKFEIKITSFDKVEDSIVAKFDPAYTRKLVYQISSILPGFRQISTDFIKIIRHVPPEQIDGVLEIVKTKFKTDIAIDRIAIAGGQLRQEDILWTGPLAS